MCVDLDSVDGLIDDSLLLRSDVVLFGCLKPSQPDRDVFVVLAFQCSHVLLDLLLGSRWMTVKRVPQRGGGIFSPPSGF